MRLFNLLLLICLLISCASNEQIPDSESVSKPFVTAQKEYRVSIRVQLPDGVTGPVYLTGNVDALGPWNPNGLLMSGQGKIRTAEIQLPQDFHFEYKFTLGSWEREAVGPSGMVMPNRKMKVDANRQVRIEIVDFKKDPLAYIEDWQGSGVLGTLVYWKDVPSAHLAHTRHVSIWLPPEYQAHPQQRYRVIYMSDGQNLFDPRIANTGVDWGVDEAMMKLVAEGVEPAIVVGVWNSSSRGMEYSPWHDAPRYAQFLTEELLPRVNADFRTRTGPQNTAHIGSSMGGLLSFYLVTQQSQYFGSCGCMSTHFPLSESIVAQYFADANTPATPNPKPYVLRDIEAGMHAPSTARMWFDYGTVGLDAEYGPSHAQVRQWLLAQGFVEQRDFVVRAYQGAEHSEAAWRARLQDPLRFLLAAPAKLGSGAGQ